MLLPQLEDQLDLPACPIKAASIDQTRRFSRNIGGPGLVQAARAEAYRLRRLALLSGVSAQVAAGRFAATASGARCAATAPAPDHGRPAEPAHPPAHRRLVADEDSETDLGHPLRFERLDDDIDLQPAQPEATRCRQRTEETAGWGGPGGCSAAGCQPAAAHGSRTHGDHEHGRPAVLVPPRDPAADPTASGA